MYFLLPRYLLIKVYLLPIIFWCGQTTRTSPMPQFETMFISTIPEILILGHGDELFPRIRLTIWSVSQKGVSIELNNKGQCPHTRYPPCNPVGCPQPLWKTCLENTWIRLWTGKHHLPILREHPPWGGPIPFHLPTICKLRK